MRSRAAFASAALANRPKQVAPDPDMRASSASVSRIAARQFAILGISAMAGASRSLRQSRRKSTSASALVKSGRCLGMGGLSRCPSALNTAGVDMAAPGLTSTTCRGGKAGSGVRISPRPCIRTGRLARQAGTSAPSISSRSGRASSARSTAAASAEPPPMPEATGRFFSSVIRASRPASRAARRQRLSGSAARPWAKGPVRLSDSGPGATVTTSPNSRNTTSESSR